MNRNLCLGCLVAGLACTAHAKTTDSFYHYNEILLGQRAMGLGGAYCAISDDASAVVYNPGGMAFADGDSFSGSVNTYIKKDIAIKGVLDGRDLRIGSSGTGTFFGLVHKLDFLSPNLVGGFAVYTPAFGSSNQEMSLDAPETLKLTQTFDKMTEDYRQFTVTAGLAYRERSLGFGGALEFSDFASAVQEYFHGRIEASPSDLNTGGTVYMEGSQLADVNLHTRMLSATFGTKVLVNESLSLGLSLKTSMFILQNLVYGLDFTGLYKRPDGSVVGKNEVKDPDYGPPLRQHKKRTEKEIFRSAPSSIRVGVAYTAHPRLLLTADAQTTSAWGGGAISNFPRAKAVTNFSLGTEYKPIAFSWRTPLRAGFFSNYDAQPPPSQDVYSLRADSYGSSFFAGIIKGSTEISAGAIYQVGHGRTNLIQIGDSRPTSNVISTSLQFALAVSSREF